VRRGSRVRRARWALGAAGLLAGLYAWLAEPCWIEVTRHRVRAPLDAPLTIAHLSDLHTSGLGRPERALLAVLERERPDAIVITGDTVVNGDLFFPVRGMRDDPAYGLAAPLLDRLRAPLGVWAVRGNWENVRRTPDERGFYERHGIRLLVNEAAELRAGVWLAGFDDIQNAPDLAGTVRQVPPGVFAVALFHSPAYFDRLDGRFPLALAGHTHGGQVRPPFVPPFWLPAGSGKYVAGWYASGGSRLYVSRGVGTSTLPIRFRCRPEVALVTLESGRD
jgi:uncharacterized protein